MVKVQVFKPNRKYRLTKDYHHEAWPLKYDAKAGDILVFAYKTAGGHVQFYKAKPDENSIFQPIMMKASEAFKLLEDAEVSEDLI